MNSERIGMPPGCENISLEELYANEKPRDLDCPNCGVTFREGTGAVWERRSGPEEFCSADCLEVQGEAAEQVRLERYYGGSGPASLQAQCAEAKRLK